MRYLLLPSYGVIIQCNIDDLINSTIIARSKSKRAMLAMCVSMSANCGGTATTIGTGPNLIMFELIIDTFPECPLSFATWMAFAIPQLIICLIIVWIWLQLYYLPLPWKVYVFVYPNADRQ